MTPDPDWDAISNLTPEQIDAAKKQIWSPMGGSPPLGFQTSAQPSADDLAKIKADREEQLSLKKEREEKEEQDEKERERVLREATNVRISQAEALILRDILDQDRVRKQRNLDDLKKAQKKLDEEDVDRKLRRASLERQIRQQESDIQQQPCPSNPASDDEDEAMQTGSDDPTVTKPPEEMQTDQSGLDIGLSADAVAQLDADTTEVRQALDITFSPLTKTSILALVGQCPLQLMTSILPGMAAHKAYRNMRAEETVDSGDEVDSDLEERLLAIPQVDTHETDGSDA